VSPIDGRHLGLPWLISSSRGDPPRGLGSPKKPARAKARRRRMGKRQGCQRHGSFGSARKKTPRANPGDPPKRIGRRETPGPPVS
jgi:hypothetical protein